jgi:hypothetical protein
MPQSSPVSRHEFLSAIRAQMDADFGRLLPQDLGGMSEPDKYKRGSEIYKHSIVTLVDGLGLDEVARQRLLSLHERRIRISDLSARLQARNLAGSPLVIEPALLDGFFQDFKDGLRQIIESGDNFTIGIDAEGGIITPGFIIEEVNEAQKRVRD